MIEMTNKILLLLSVLVVTYVAIGGVVFYYLEKDHKEEIKQPDLTNLTEAFLASNPAFNRSEIEAFAQTIIDAYGNATQTTSANWTIGQGLYIAVTIITTIGYGDVVTKTPGGQWFTIFYGVVGIPLNLAMLGGVGTKIRQMMKSILKRIQKRRGETWSLRKNKAVGVTAVLLLGLLVMFIAPALIFRLTEKWTFTESFYFSFITLSTVGFGDYVATRDSSHLNRYLIVYRLLLFVWIYLGLAWLSTLLSVLQEIYNSAIETGEHKLETQISKRVFHKPGVVTGQASVSLGKTEKGSLKGDKSNGQTNGQTNDVHENEGYAPDITPVDAVN